MKKILFLILSVYIAAGCSSLRQTPEQKEMQRNMEQQQYEEVVEALNNKTFVLEANQIRFRRGRTAYVSPATNFVMLNEQRATVQVAFNTVYAGPNGIGGITLDGNVSQIQSKTDKKGNITYSFGVIGTGISAQVVIFLTKNGNKATVDINPNFSGNRITLTGNIYPLEQSAVFKGRSL